MARRQTRCGFTLVELLVVVGLIGILIALILPSLNKAREQAKTTACASQLRQLGNALIIYTQSNRGYLPSWSGWHTLETDGTGEDTPGPAWTEQLARAYVKPDHTIYNCPSFPADRKVNYFLAARYSYLSGRQSFKIDEIKLGSRFVMSGDCTQSTLYPAPFGSTAHAIDDVDKDDASNPGVVWKGQAGGINIHQAGNNLLFADGHVTTYKQFDRLDITFHPKQMLNWAEIQ